ncbi:MAG: N-formylglutamate amidohydrolase [Halobacteriovoraceae bacterium]|nr:N-formylglutamate amidohydrolase [Halobacteriovoraceae bacterium]
MKSKVIISCEHGGAEIPKFLNSSVKIPKNVLESHRGLDKGALDIAKKLGKKIRSTPILNKMTRLVIDFNRSLHNYNVFSKFSKNLDNILKEKLIELHSKHRAKIFKQISKNTIHLSVHSFTPKMNGVMRNCEFSILFDPKRADERHLALEIKKKLSKLGIKCRFNYPYLGKSDGVTTHFRKIFLEGYLGLELEFNQRIVNHKNKVETILDVVCESSNEFKF